MLGRGLSYVRRFVYGDSGAKATKQTRGDTVRSRISKIMLASQKCRRIRGEGYEVIWQPFFPPTNQYMYKLP